MGGIDGHLNLRAYGRDAFERVSRELHFTKRGTGAARLHADIEDASMCLFPTHQCFALQFRDVPEEILRGGFGSISGKAGRLASANRVRRPFQSEARTREAMPTQAEQVNGATSLRGQSSGTWQGPCRIRLGTFGAWVL